MVRSESGPKLLWPVALTLCLPNTPYQFWPHLHSMTIYRGQFWSIIGVPAWLYCGAYTFSNRFLSHSFAIHCCVASRITAPV